VHHWARFLADRTNGRAIGTVLRPPVVVCNVMYCGKTVRPIAKGRTVLLL